MIRRTFREYLGEHSTVVAAMAEIVSPPEWMADALCAQVDPDAFFVEKGGSTAAAKRICARCDVRAECLQLALDRGERYGVYGGLSERERRKLKRVAA